MKNIYYLTLECGYDRFNSNEEFVIGRFTTEEKLEEARKEAKEKIVPLARKYYDRVRLVEYDAYLDAVNEVLLCDLFWEKTGNV